MRSNFDILQPILFKLVTHIPYGKGSIARVFQPPGAGGGRRSHVDLRANIFIAYFDRGFNVDLLLVRNHMLGSTPLEAGGERRSHVDLWTKKYGIFR